MVWIALSTEAHLRIKFHIKACHLKKNRRILVFELSITIAVFIISKMKSLIP